MAFYSLCCVPQDKQVNNDHILGQQYLFEALTQNHCWQRLLNFMSKI